jgi:CrcB protein
MITAVAFALAAAGGALARAEAGRRWNRHEGLSVGTLVVNVTGSFLLGLLSDVTPPTLTVLGVGGLGAFTTFSSFARDAVALAEQGRMARSVLYVALSCAGGIAAAGAGVVITSAS